MSLNIAKSNKKRVVIVGGGFGGLKLANKLKKSVHSVLAFHRRVPDWLHKSPFRL